MEQSEQPTQPAFGVVPEAAQIAYATDTYQPAAAVAGAPQATTVISDIRQLNLSFPTGPANLTSHRLACNHRQQLLQCFWVSQTLEIKETTDFKNHCIPLARIKKIMTADEGVHMVASEVPVVIAKACELFILELTLRSWIHTEEDWRTTLRKNDIAAAITRTQIFNFLVDIVSKDQSTDESFGVANAALPRIGTPADSNPCYSASAAHMAGAGMMIENPKAQTALYAVPPPYPVAQTTLSEIMIENPADQTTFYAVPPPYSVAQMAGAGMMIENPADQMTLYAVPPRHPVVQMAGAEIMTENPTDQMTFYAVPPSHSVAQTASAGMIIENPVDQMALYAVPPSHPLAQMADAEIMIENRVDQIIFYADPPPHSVAQIASAEMMIENPTDQMALYASPPPHPAAYLLPQPQVQQQQAAQHDQQVSEGDQSNVFLDV